MARTRRSAPCGLADARSRLRIAEAYLQTAELVEGEEREGFANVTAGLAVLAGIAASDAICCARIGRRPRGEDHREALGMLEGATTDGKRLRSALERLLGSKDAAHYSTRIVGQPSARLDVRRARNLVERAREEVER